jgi:hypothetical protein
MAENSQTDILKDMPSYLRGKDYWFSFLRPVGGIDLNLTSHGNQAGGHCSHTGDRSTEVFTNILDDVSYVHD